jgi:hypothetical protein
MTQQPPEWRKAWKLDDPEWVKQRKAEWKRLKQHPILGNKEWFKPAEQKAIKNFFMAGMPHIPEPPEREWEWDGYNPDLPLETVDGGVLLECWLTADQSEANWRHIAGKYAKSTFMFSRRRLREWLRNKFPERGCLFDGLEERLYLLFDPTRCRPEDFPEETHLRFINDAWRTYNDLKPMIRGFFLSQSPNPCNIAPVMLREWCDAIPWAYEALRNNGKGNERLQVKSVTEILTAAADIIQSPKGWGPRQVESAKRLLEFMRDTELPEELDSFLRPIIRL